jgi:hypothetical protein
VVRRDGRSALGCLLLLLVLVAVGYFAVNVGEVYFRFYQFRDSMEQTARFAAHYDDETIRQRLRSAADSLNLPESARQIQVRRREHYIVIWTEYFDHIELPGYVREVRFNPRVESAF